MDEHTFCVWTYIWYERYCLLILYFHIAHFTSYFLICIYICIYRDVCINTYGCVILRCVIPVVLSNNKNKLMVHMYIVTNTTTFLIVRLLLLRYNYMFRPSMLAIFRLYMKHLTISYIYMWVGSLQFVGWGGCKISFCVCRRGVDQVCC